MRAFGLLVILGIALWAVYLPSRSEILLRVAMYPTLLAVLVAGRLLVIHTLNWGESHPLQWYHSPFMVTVPVLVLCFYFMFW